MNIARLIYSVIGFVPLCALCACKPDQGKIDQGESSQNETSIVNSEREQRQQESVISENEKNNLESVVMLDEKQIIIPGLQDEYKVVFVNDQHIIVPDGNYMDEKSEEVAQRCELFCDQNGQTSRETWSMIVDQINALEPDGVVLNGDMIDFFSEGNLECLMKEMKRIEYPTMYIRADHDLAIWYSNTISQDYVYEKELETWEMEDVMIQEFDDFMIVGINNNTSYLSNAGLQKLKELWQLNKPIILAMHVPLKSQLNNELSDMSKALWQDRALLWGEECYYIPDEVTKQFLDLVYAENSPVVAVMRAHLHFPYEDQLNKNIKQIVFDASFKRVIGVVDVKGNIE